MSQQNIGMDFENPSFYLYFLIQNIGMDLEIYVRLFQKYLSFLIIVSLSVHGVFSLFEYLCKL